MSKEDVAACTVAVVDDRRTGSRTRATRPPRFRHSRKAGLLKVFIFNILLLVIPVAFYYLTAIQDQRAYATDRGFRTLAELETQINNTLETLLSLFPFLPDALTASSGTKEMVKTEDLINLDALTSAAGGLGSVEAVRQAWEPYFEFLCSEQQMCGSFLQGDDEKAEIQKALCSELTGRELFDEPCKADSNTPGWGDFTERAALARCAAEGLPPSCRESGSPELIVRILEKSRAFADCKQQQTHSSHCLDSAMALETYQAVYMRDTRSESDAGASNAGTRRMLVHAYWRHLEGMLSLADSRWNPREHQVLQLIAGYDKFRKQQQLHLKKIEKEKEADYINAWKAFFIEGKIEDKRREYQGRIGLDGVQVRLLEDESPASGQLGKWAKQVVEKCRRDLHRTAVHVLAESPYSSIFAFTCEDRTNARTPYFEMPLRALLGTSASREFSQVYLTDRHGSILSTLARTVGATADETVQDVVRPPALFRDLRDLLWQAGVDNLTRTSDSPEAASVRLGALQKALSGEKSAPPTLDQELPVTMPKHQTVVERHLAGQDLRIFIKPFKPEQRVTVSASAACADENCDSVPHDVFYLVGVAEKQPFEHTTLALRPLVVLSMIVVLVIALISWPLLRLVFLEPHDALHPVQMALTLLAAASVMSVTYLGMRTYAELREFRMTQQRHAGMLANEIAMSLRAELGLHAEALHRIAKLPQFEIPSQSDWPTCGKNGQFFARKASADDDLRGECESEEARKLKDAFARIACVRDRPGGDLAPVCPYSNVFRLRSTGEKSGTLLGFYAQPHYPHGFDLSNRRYFQAMHEDRHWSLGGDAPAFVAERIYNRGDGDKRAQIAVLAECRQSKSRFCGIVTADAHMYAYTHPVLPLHYQSAVVDDSTGSVVFHSDDRRSLVENFYVETDGDTQLKAAIAQAQADEFHGTYHGRRHGFAYAPVSDTPWSVVVFYDLAVGDMIAVEAFTNVIVAYVPLVLWQVLVVILAAKCLGSPMLWLWPQWRARNAYLIALPIGVLDVLYIKLLDALTGAVPHAVALAAFPVAILALCYFVFAPRGSTVAIGSASLRAVAFCVHVLALAVLVASASTAGRVEPACWILLAVYCATLWLVMRREAVEGPGGAGHSESPNRWRRDFRSYWRWVRTLEGYELIYMLHLALLAVSLFLIPAGDIFERSIERFANGALGVASDQSLASLERRLEHIEEVFRRHLPQASARARHVPLHRVSRDLPVFGLGKPRSALSSTLRISDAPPTSSDTGHGSSASPVPPIMRLRMQFGPNRCLANGSVSVQGGRGRLGAGSVRNADGHICVQRAVRVQGRTLTATQVTPDWARMRAAFGCGAGARDDCYWTNNVGMGALLVAAVLLVVFMARRLLGVGLPWTGLTGPLGVYERDALCDIPTRHAMLVGLRDNDLQRTIRSSAGQEYDLASVTAECRVDLTDAIRTAALYQRLATPASSDPAPRPSESPATASPGDAGKRIWLLSRLDIAVTDSATRASALPLLEWLVAQPGNTVLLAVDVAPLYRALKPAAYPDSDSEYPTDELQVDTFNALRWSRLLASFRKVYVNRTPAPPAIDAEDALGDKAKKSLLDYAERELRSFWPELRNLEPEVRQLIESNVIQSPRAVQDFIGSHAGPMFRARWEYCTRQERLLLYQLARGWFVNVTNGMLLERVIRRGFVVLEPSPRLVNDTVRSFVLEAEPPGRFESWLSEASEGVWQSIRLPFFIILMLMVAWLAYSAGEMFETMAAIAASTLGFLGTLLRAIGVARGTSSQT
jgi:hypothetical protein